jgi:hypothetical protein
VGSDRFQPVLPLESAQDAMSDLYGQAIVRELGSILHDSADKACLTAKAISREQLDRTAADLLIRYGQKVYDRLLETIDPRTFEEEFTRLGGRQARAEMRQLASDPFVGTYLANDRPARHDRMVDTIAEHFDRYMLLKRHKLKRDLSPASTANEELLSLHRGERVEIVLNALVEKAGSNKNLQRFLGLAEMNHEAVKKAMLAKLKMDNKRSIELGPVGAFAGVETELRDLCIAFNG